jgi:hypothetical protein
VARTKNTRSTTIYWLVDVRPRTIASGWVDGKPFYCGKTVGDVKRRLSMHFSIVRDWPDRKLSVALNEVGRSMIVQVMEIVPPSANWSARERYWIKILRGINSDCANTADGGQGATGYVPSAEHRAKLRDANRKSPRAIEARTKLQASLKGRKFSDVHRANLSMARKKSPKALAAALTNLQVVNIRRMGRAAIMEMHGPDVFRLCKPRAAAVQIPPPPY